MRRGTTEDALVADDRESPRFARRTTPLGRFVPASVVLAFALQGVFLVVDAATDSYDVARTGEVLRVALTFASAVTLFAFVHLAFTSHRRVAKVVTSLLFFFFVFVNACRQATMGAFDYGFV